MTSAAGRPPLLRWEIRCQVSLFETRGRRRADILKSDYFACFVLYLNNKVEHSCHSRLEGRRADVTRLRPGSSSNPGNDKIL